MLKPTGFWSYAASDDASSRGRLGQLRTLLADALQSNIGRPKVHIFQDVAAIPYGANWEKEIDQALDQSSFFIPIITPAFLHSEWCCREVMQFRERQAALGRDDLIFPIHYLDVGAFDTVRRDECHDPAVLDHLRRHQWVDFLKLRFLPLDTSGEIAQKLDGIASAICAAMYRAVATIVNPSAADPPPAMPSATPRPMPEPPPATVIRDGLELPEMELIPPGRFIMGIPKEESARERTIDDDARPQHEVTFRQGFYLAKYPVTRAGFAAFVADSGYTGAGSDWLHSGFEQTDRDPVVNVSVIDAEAYVEWLSDKTGSAYRLPSEAEWEYAARAGTTTARFWGNGWDEAPAYLNTGSRGTSPVGSFKPNGFGLCDMLGNVWEWTADRWHDDYRGAPNDGSAWTTGSEGRGFCAAVPGTSIRGASAPAPAAGVMPATAAAMSASAWPELVDPINPRLLTSWEVNEAKPSGRIGDILQPSASASAKDTPSYSSAGGSSILISGMPSTTSLDTTCPPQSSPAQVNTVAACRSCSSMTYRCIDGVSRYSWFLTMRSVVEVLGLKTSNTTTKLPSSRPAGTRRTRSAVPAAPPS